jgi:Holliday junction resolvase-like predicted endonuclease
MERSSRVPAGPRGAIGAAAEAAAVAYLRRAGWLVLGRNVRVGRDEIDILALEPGEVAVTVVLEVRARSGPGFGAAVESVDARKVARLYRAAWNLQREGCRGLPADATAGAVWRVDLLTLVRGSDGDWRIEQHMRGLAPP